MMYDRVKEGSKMEFGNEKLGLTDRTDLVDTCVFACPCMAR
jgi:hypothetical protein